MSSTLLDRAGKCAAACDRICTETDVYTYVISLVYSVNPSCCSLGVIVISCNFAPACCGAGLKAPLALCLTKRPDLRAIIRALPGLALRNSEFRALSPYIQSISPPVRVIDGNFPSTQNIKRASSASEDKITTKTALIYGQVKDVWRRLNTSTSRTAAQRRATAAIATTCDGRQFQRGKYRYLYMHFLKRKNK